MELFPDLPRVSLRFTLGYALLRFAFPFSRRPSVQRDKRKSCVKWQPAFRLVKVVFVVVNRQHRVHNQAVVPVVCVVVERNLLNVVSKTRKSLHIGIAHEAEKQ